VINHVKIGSTKCGIGPCYSDKINRKGKQIKDVPKIIEKMKLKMINISHYFYNMNGRDMYLFFEGAQGFELDIDWGDYPYTTSSNCTSGGIYNCGIYGNKIRHIFGIAKIYDTYVGSKYFQKNSIDLEKLGNIGNEIGSTTGRKRQVNWLHLEKLKNDHSSK